MPNIFPVINMVARTLLLMIIFRWKSRDGSRRQAVTGGKSKIGQLIYKGQKLCDTLESPTWVSQ